MREPLCGLGGAAASRRPGPSTPPVSRRSSPASPPTSDSIRTMPEAGGAAGPQADDSMRGSLHICVTATVAGVLIGFVGGAFRWCLQNAEGLRGHFVGWAHELPGPGWLVPMVAVAAGATLAALIQRREPLAAGSGIQHVRSELL